MARLVSVNVGLPRDITWRGNTVHTGIYKAPVSGRCTVGRLNLAGDGQGDLGGHGGENRAVFVYQLEAYAHWREHLSKHDLTHGQFGENFTIEGLTDDVVCIGDRYRIGSAVFEVTQPRVTCYRVGIRLDEPRMPALLTASGKTGFYFRVLEEGDVGAGDEIVKIGESASERMSVSSINALLYSSSHPQQQLERALRISALSPGWRWSFEQLLQSAKTGGDGNPGLAPASTAQRVASGFRSVKVASILREAAGIVSFYLERTGGDPLPPSKPGQYVVLRLRGSDGTTLLRSYSLSAAASDRAYRVSVKIEPHGAAGRYMSQDVTVGKALEVSAPRGAFFLEPGEAPVVLVSAGIGVTPVLAMLHDLAHTRSIRAVYWLHVARDGEHHPFKQEVDALLAQLPNSRCRIWFSRPGERDRQGKDFDVPGRPTKEQLQAWGIPSHAVAYICGPDAFMSDAQGILMTLGLRSGNIRTEVFAGGASLKPGIVDASLPKTPHQPEGEQGSGPLISFARSGVSVRWHPSRYQSLLELAEACDVPVRWSCRSGVCHNCESGLISGTVDYLPDPLDAPGEGNVLICCARPTEDAVIDL